MKDNDKNHPIQFIGGEESCRWNGKLMSAKTCEEMFGIDGELDVDEEDVCIIGETIYVRLDKCIDLPEGEFIVKDYKDLSLINIQLLREFTEDLNDYYEHPTNKPSVKNKNDYKIFN